MRLHLACRQAHDETVPLWGARGLVLLHRLSAFRLPRSHLCALGVQSISCHVTLHSCVHNVAGPSNSILFKDKNKILGIILDYRAMTCGRVGHRIQRAGPQPFLLPQQMSRCQHVAEQVAGDAPDASPAVPTQ